MKEVDALTNMTSENLLSFITISFALFFLIIAVMKGFQFLATYFGWESKQERRLRQLEKAQKDLIAENDKLKTEISAAEQRCKNAISETETKFDNRERDHWEESKQIKCDYDEKITNQDKKLDIILQKLEQQEKLNFKDLRHSIVKAGESYINRGSVKIRELCSLEELYEEYANTYDGNSYVETLMIKVRALDIIGKLNEHGEDIE